MAKKKIKTTSKGIKKSTLAAYVAAVALLLISLIWGVQLEHLFLLQPNLSAISSNALEVHFVDVGQGDAALVRFPNNKTMLIDSGSSTAKNNLLNYINKVFFKNQQPKFNYVLLTHSDEDHSGNMLTVLNTYPVEVFYRPAIYADSVEEPNGALKSTTQVYKSVITKLLQLKAENETEVITFEAGITINNAEGEELVRLLTPNRTVYKNPNDYSPVMYLTYSGKKIMLTGDASGYDYGVYTASQIGDKTSIETEAQDYATSAQLKADVLKMGHHGSKFSTSASFLQAVAPTYGVISVGTNNYGHPDADVFSRIESFSLAQNNNLKDNIYTTKELGNIVCYVNLNKDVAFLFLGSVNSYMFISWWVVVAGGIAVITVFVFYPTLKKNNKKTSAKR